MVDLTFYSEMVRGAHPTSPSLIPRHHFQQLNFKG